jgi:uncharacterized LabA/DUF88 family protein
MDDKSESVYAFIDGQNLNLSIQNDILNKSNKLIYHGWKLDFQRFYIYLKDKFKIAKAYYFIGFMPENKHLFRFLESAGYQVIYKPTLEYVEGKEKRIKGNVDAELVLHTMIEFPNYNKAIIVAGDGDYHCLIKYLEEQNKLLHVLIPNKYSFSSLLREYHRYLIYVSDLQSKLEFKIKSRGSNLRTKP